MGAAIGIILILVVVALSVPVRWLWFEFKLFSLPRITVPFAPTPAELTNAEMAQIDYQTAVKRKKKAIHRGKEAGIRVRNDDLFDERSPDARKLNNAIDKAESNISTAMVTFWESQRGCLERFENWSNIQTNVWVLRGCVLGTLIATAFRLYGNLEPFFTWLARIYSVGFPTGLMAWIAVRVWIRQFAPIHELTTSTISSFQSRHPAAIDETDQQYRLQQ